MKRAIILIVLAMFAISCTMAQTKAVPRTNGSAYDSAAVVAEKNKLVQDTLDLFYKEVGNQATIDGFNTWADENLTSKKYRETKPLLDAYMNFLLQDWITKKRAGPGKK